VKLTHIRLLVADVAISTAYYRDVLGLDVALEAGDVYAELKAGDAILGLYRKDLMAQRLGASYGDDPSVGPNDAFCLTFDVRDVDTSFRGFLDRGAIVAKEPHDHAEAFLRVAHLRDPDGNLIEINHSTYQG
jgi:catechol 2,3-dioxygenase-like lactoylglutathione lyase family enzyme